jgi:leucyl-tRNA synthetase
MGQAEDAKSKVRKQLLDLGLGFAYAEPERKVLSKPADECCVALMDQYYLDYREESWKT